MLLIDIFKIILNIIYLPFKLIKMDRKILFLSRQSNNLTLDYKIIINALKKEDSSIKIKVISRKLEKNIFSLLINFLLLFNQMYHLATSQIVITDGYSIPISILKHKKKLIIIQLWHANGIIKKIGLQTLEKRSKSARKLALKMNMHKNYSYAISSSQKASKVFSKAFNINLKNILNYGTPTLDYIYHNKNNKSKEIKEKYDLGRKKIIVYLPTYRKKSINYNELINKINFQKYHLVIKKHPVDNSNINKKGVVIVNDYIAEDIISIADYVISDYSNVVFESLLSGKKTFCYIYDYEQYKNEVGFNIDLKKEFSKFSFTNFDDIIKAIDEEKYDYQESQKFVNKYIDNYDGNSTKRIIEFILKKMK